MAKKNFVQLYDPANAKSLTKEDLAAMQDLSVDEIKELAKTYPNKPSGGAYLVIANKNEKGKQLFPRSTWANLWNLIKMGQKGWYAISFTSVFRASNVAQQKVAAPQDLTAEEVKNAPGLKKAAVKPAKAQEQDVEVKEDLNETNEVEELEVPDLQEKKTVTKAAVKKAAPKKAAVKKPGEKKK